MKKILVILFVLSAVYAGAETVDSLKAKRERLYQKYSDLNIPGKEISKENQQKTISILKDIVIVDTRIIRENAAYDKKIQQYEAEIKKLTDEKTELTKQIADSTDRMMVVYVFVGVLVVLLIFLLFMFIRGRIGGKSKSSPCCG